MPFELIDYILRISNIKCKTCYKQILNNDVKNLIFKNKKYYCSKQCYLFI